MKQAAEKAKSLDPKKVAEVMHSGMTFHTVIGDIAYDKKGDRTSVDYVWYVWKKGPRRQDHLPADRILTRRPRGARRPAGPARIRIGNPPETAGFSVADSPDLPELRERLDQPERNVLEAAGQERDAGRDQEHADRLLDPAELFAHVRGARA